MLISNWINFARKQYVLGDGKFPLYSAISSIFRWFPLDISLDTAHFTINFEEKLCWRKQKQIIAKNWKSSVWIWDILTFDMLKKCVSVHCSRGNQTRKLENKMRPGFYNNFDTNTFKTIQNQQNDNDNEIMKTQLFQFCWPVWCQLHRLFV